MVCVATKNPRNSVLCGGREICVLLGDSDTSRKTESVVLAAKLIHGLAVLWRQFVAIERIRIHLSGVRRALECGRHAARSYCACCATPGVLCVTGVLSF